MVGQKTIKEARESLLRFLAKENLCGSPSNKMTVVFDGQPGICYPHKTFAIRVIFSSHGTADDLIKKMVEEAKNKKSLYVITDDKSLQQGVRGLGAKVLSIKSFFGRMDQSRQRLTRVKMLSQERTISKIEECKINDELEKIWVK